MGEGGRGRPMKGQRTARKRHRCRKTTHASDKLLKEHCGRPNPYPPDIGPSGEEIQVWLNHRTDTALTGDLGLPQFALNEHLGLDFEEFVDDGRVFDGGGAEVGERVLSHLVAADLREPARRVWHPEHSDTEQNGREDLQSDRDSPARRILTSAASGGNVVVGIERGVTVGSDRARVRHAGCATSPADMARAVAGKEGRSGPVSRRIEERELVTGNSRNPVAQEDT